MKPDQPSHADLHEDIIRNRSDIEIIREHIDIIKNNHLHHIEKDMAGVNERITKLDSKIDRIDDRQWTIILLIIGSILLPLLIGVFG